MPRSTKQLTLQGMPTPVQVCIRFGMETSTLIRSIKTTMEADAQAKGLPMTVSETDIVRGYLALKFEEYAKRHNIKLPPEWTTYK